MATSFNCGENYMILIIILEYYLKVNHTYV